MGRCIAGLPGDFDQVRAGLVAAIRDVDPARKTLYLTGHSLGGALATIAACELLAEFPITGIYTFGQPRVGDAVTAAFIRYHYPTGYHRFVFDDDIVPRVPPGYTHVGRLYHFDANGFVQRSASDTGGEATEQPPLTPAEFEWLKETARAIEVESHAASPAMEETQDELADRSLEGIFASVRDHRMSRYLFAIRNQIPRTSPLSLDEAELYRAGDFLGPITTRHGPSGVETFPVQVRVRDLSWTPPPGVIVNSRVGPFYSVLATQEAIGDMQRDSRVFSLSPSREVDPHSAQELAVSVPFVLADAIHSGNLNERGDSAIIGLIDSGIDILHEAFLDNKGTPD